MNESTVIVSNLEDIDFFINVNTQAITTTSFDTPNEGDKSLLFFISNQPTYLISLANSGFTIKNIITEQTKLYSDTTFTLSQTISMIQYDDSFFMCVALNQGDYQITIHAINIETSQRFDSPEVSTSTIYIAKLGLLQDKTVVLAFTKAYSSANTIYIIYYLFDGSIFTMTYSIDDPSMNPQITEFDFVQLEDDSSLLFCFHHSLSTDLNIHCKDYTVMRVNLDVNFQFDTGTTNVISNLHIGKIGENTYYISNLDQDNQHFQLLFLHYFGSSDYYYSDILILEKPFIHGNIVALSDFSFYIVRIIQNGALYEYYGDIMSFAFDDKYPTLVNPENHWAFYKEHLTDYYTDTLCQNILCLTCSENTNTVSGCDKCGVKKDFTSWDPTTFQC